MKRRGYRNRRKFEIEEAKAKDGTYQAIKLFAKSTKVIVIHQTEALKKKYFLLEYENNGEPSGISDTRAEFLRVKARRYWRVGDVEEKDGIKYVKMPTEELIRWY